MTAAILARGDAAMAAAPVIRNVLRSIDFDITSSRAITAHGLFIELDPQSREVSWIGIALANVDRLHDEIVHALVAENVARQRAVRGRGARVEHRRVQNSQLVSRAVPDGHSRGAG